MRVLLVTPDYPPVLNSAARLFDELADDLSTSGHTITVMTRIPERYLATSDRRHRFRLVTRENTKDIRVWRMRNLPGPRHIPLARILEQLWMAATFLLLGALLRRQQAVIVYSPPLPLAITAYLLARFWRGAVVVNIQDLYPQAAIDIGLIRSRLVIKVSEAMESFLYRRADVISVHSEGNRRHVLGRGGAAERVRVVPNWVDLRAYASTSSANGWRAAQGLEGAFIVSFAGTMGFYQGLDQVLESADQLRDSGDIMFVLSGDGVFRGSLEKTAEEKDLKGIRFLPPQPEEEYVKLLMASDVCLVTLDKNLTTPVVPGKLQSIMAAGRPVVFCANPSSDSRKLIEEAGCGYFVSSGDSTALTRAILELHGDPEMATEMGRRGQRYAEKHFDRKSCTGMYNAILGKLRPETEVSR